MATFYVYKVDIDHFRQWLALAHSELRSYLEGETHISMKNGHFLKIVTNWDLLDDLKMLPGASDLTASENIGVIAREGWIEDGKVCWHLPDRKALELFDYANRHGRVTELLEILREERPHENWSIETGD